MAKVAAINEIGKIQPEEQRVLVYQHGDLDWHNLKIGQVSELAGTVSHQYVEKAVELALQGQVGGVVTAPINKGAWSKAGYKEPGHTELLAILTGARSSRMLLVSPRLSVVHVTTHVALSKVPSLLSTEKIITTITLLWDALVRMGFESPRIAVSGLNPHAGEAGLFGDEEINIIEPALRLAREKGYPVAGPLPGDTVFYRASRGEFDAVVAMYHDQGHIALKMLGFEEGVNVSLGLPIVRTSVDHGTAFDIAWQGKASPKSMIEAIKLASKLVCVKNV